jgi:hypothetical protein
MNTAVKYHMPSRFFHVRFIITSCSSTPELVAFELHVVSKHIKERYDINSVKQSMLSLHDVMKRLQRTVKQLFSHVLRSLASIIRATVCKVLSVRIRQNKLEDQKPQRKNTSFSALPSLQGDYAKLSTVQSLRTQLRGSDEKAHTCDHR